MASKKKANKDSAFGGMIMDIIQTVYKDLKENVISHIPVIKKKIEKKLRLASQKIFGQKIALIGPPAVGKTSLLKVLRNPQIDKEELQNYRKTGAGESYKGFQVEWNVPVDEEVQILYKFKVNAGLDNGGEDYIREGNWLEAVKDCRVIFYLFDFGRFDSEKTKSQEMERIQKDFDWIGDHVNAFKENFIIIPIGNKVDLLCKSLSEFRTLQESKLSTLENLRKQMLNSVPKGYQSNIKQPVLLSLFDKKIRNEQFADLMLAVIGENLVSLIRECESKSDEVA